MPNFIQPLGKRAGSHSSVMMIESKRIEPTRVGLTTGTVQLILKEEEKN
jgi:hypothetical protein